MGERQVRQEVPHPHSLGGLNLAADFGSVREGSAVAFCSVPIWVRAFCRSRLPHALGLSPQW